MTLLQKSFKIVFLPFQYGQLSVLNFHEYNVTIGFDFFRQ